MTVREVGAALDAMGVLPARVARVATYQTGAIVRLTNGQTLEFRR